LHVTTILVHHYEDLLHDVVDLSGWNTEAMQQASHEWRMLPEQLVRGHMVWNTRWRDCSSGLLVALP
jgi:hypothetical protein